MKPVLFGLLLLIAGLLPACKKDSVQADVSIESYTPHARGGDEITITGSGFSAKKEENIVTISNKAAVITEANPNYLKVTVPLKAGNGRIAVKVGTKNAESSTDLVYDWIGAVSDLTGAVFNGLQDVAADINGNIYAADMGANLIYKVPANANGIATADVFAGDGTGGWSDGAGTAASFNSPIRLTTDKTGNILVVDLNNKRLRKITPAGVVSTMKKPATNGNIVVEYIEGIAVDDGGNIFLSDFAHSVILKVNTDGETLQYATGGEGQQFNTPTGMCIGKNGNLFAVCYNSHNIFEITKNIDGLGKPLLLAGSPTGVRGREDGNPGKFSSPYGITADGNGNLYVADYEGHCIRMISKLENGNVNVSTIAGSLNFQMGAENGTGTAARFDSPAGITISPDGGTLYVADRGNKKIRKVVLQ